MEASHRGAHGSAALWMVALLTLQAAFALNLVGWRPALRGAPIVQDDYAVHLAAAIEARALFRSAGRLWGYSPWLMAGYPTGIASSVDNRSAEILVSLAWPLSAPVAFAWVLIVGYWLPPLLGYGTARLFGLSRPAAVATACLYALLFWRTAEGPRAYVRYGMYGYVVAIAMAPFVTAACFAAARAPSVRRALIAGLLLGAAMNVHAYVILLMLPVVAVCAAAVDPAPARSRLLVLAVIVAVGVLLNLHWIVPLAGVSLVFAAETPYFQDGVGALLRDVRHAHALFEHSVWLLGVGGLLALARAAGRAAVLVTVAGASTAFGLAIAGSFVPLLATLEPARFLDAVAFFLAVPAGQLAVSWRPARPAARAAILLLGLALATPALRTWRNVAFHGRTLIVWIEGTPTHGMPAAVVRLVDRLRRETTHEARIMIEDSDHAVYRHRYGYTHLPALFPHLVDREFIGGPYPEIFLAHHFVDFTAGRAFGRRLRRFDDETLEAYLNLYNVGWIVAWSPASRANLARRGFVRSMGAVGPYEMFTVAGPRTFVIDQPSARVRAALDLIEVRGAAGPETVLKYHCMTGLRVEPPLPLRCVPALEDPVGFIAVSNGTVRDFQVRFDP